jgi:GNAT superfamily N-acetyltransferase
MEKSECDVQVGTDVEMEFIDASLGEFNGRMVPFTQPRNEKNRPVLTKNYVIKNKGKIIAGIKSDVYFWGILFIGRLFVDEAHRRKGLGSLLLGRVEHEAKLETKASLAHLDTFDFQAKDFYLKHGYEIFGVLDDCPPGHQRFYLKKHLK